MSKHRERKVFRGSNLVRDGRMRRKDMREPEILAHGP
jgi:hypothetical protein